MDVIVYIQDKKVRNPAAVTTVLNQLGDGRYLLTLKSFKRRSNALNAYYWACVVDLVYEGLRDAGFDSVKNKEDAHEVMKSLFLKVFEEKAGIKIEKIKSTKELNNQEFQEYLLNISVWASDYLHVSIPEPGQKIEMFNE